MQIRIISLCQIETICVGTCVNVCTLLQLHALDALYLYRLAHPHTFPYVGKHFFLVLTERNTCVFIPP